MTPLEEQAKTPQEQWAEDSNTAARITELEAALFACAEAAGEDVSDGAPTWPDITTWAVRAVKELRKDYDDASPLLPLEVTDEMVEAGAKAMLTHERPWMDGQHPENQAGGIERRREAARACLSAALTQKGEPRACTGCANGCAGCKGKGKPYGEELMRQLRQGQKGDNE